MKINIKDNMSPEQLNNEISKAFVNEFLKYLVGCAITGGGLTYVIQQSYKIGALTALKKMAESAVDMKNTNN